MEMEKPTVLDVYWENGASDRFEVLRGNLTGDVWLLRDVNGRMLAIPRDAIKYISIDLEDTDC